VVEVRGLLLLNQIFKDADVVSIRNFDSEHPIAAIANNEAVERENL
jgi:hypothetical protein